MSEIVLPIFTLLYVIYLAAMHIRRSMSLGTAFWMSVVSIFCWAAYPTGDYYVNVDHKDIVIKYPICRAMAFRAFEKARTTRVKLFAARAWLEALAVFW
jgi:hypothetical protein